MALEKWEKFKKRDALQWISIDELGVLVIGLLVFFYLPLYRIAFIIVVILWYWLKIRHYERKIIEKERDIYNIYYDTIRPVPQHFIDAETAQAREPMYYDLRQLENNRKFLVDKFTILNLILIILIQIFFTR